MTDIIIYKDPKKSPWSIEKAHGTWEYDLMKEFEGDPEVLKWEKNHGIQIKYELPNGKIKNYEPDFLVEKVDNKIEMVEMKATNMLEDEIVLCKKKAAEEWCKPRNIKYTLTTKYIPDS